MPSGHARHESLAHRVAPDVELSLITTREELLLGDAVSGANASLHFIDPLRHRRVGCINTISLEITGSAKATEFVHPTRSESHPTAATTIMRVALMDIAQRIQNGHIRNA